MYCFEQAGEVIRDEELAQDLEDRVGGSIDKPRRLKNHNERGKVLRLFSRQSRPPLPNNLGAANNIDVDIPENPLGSPLFGQSWAEEKVQEIGAKLGPHLVDRLHRTAPQELAQPTRLI